MVGVDSFLEGLKVSSQNYLLQGLAFAIAAHLVLLSLNPINLDSMNAVETPPPSLRVSIKLEQPPSIKQDTEEAEPETQSAPPEQVKTADFLAKTIDVVALREDTPEKPKPTIQISTSSDSFSRFLKTETDRNLKHQKNKLDEFTDSFGPYFKTPEAKPEISYRDFQGPLGGGAYDVLKDGKVTCTLRMVAMTFDDLVGGVGTTTRDCTPKQKFDFKLRESTRVQK